MQAKWTPVNFSESGTPMKCIRVFFSIVRLAFIDGLILIASATAAHADDGQKATALIEKLQDVTHPDRPGLILQLEDLGGHAAPAVPILIKFLHDPDKDLSLCARQALGEIGPPARAALEDVILSNNSAPRPRRLAVLSLGRIGGETPHVLHKALQDRDKIVRRNAAMVLGDVGTANTIPFLVAVSNDNWYEVRQYVARSLGEIHQNPELSLPCLIQLLVDDDVLTRCYAAESLGIFGETASSAKDDIIKALLDKEPMVRSSACLTLPKIARDPMELNPLVDRLNDTEWQVRVAAIHAMGIISKPPDAWVAKLAQILSPAEPSSMVRYQAAAELGRWGSYAKAALPNLKRTALDDPDDDVRKIAKKSIELIDTSQK